MGNQPSTTISSRVLRSRTENLLLPKQACFHLHLYPIVSSACGSRTQPDRLERPKTSPEVKCAMFFAQADRQVGREVLESSSAVLQTAAIPSQLPAPVVVRAIKNPASRVTPGFANPVKTQSSVTSANAARVYWPVEWQHYPCLIVRTGISTLNTSFRGTLILVHRYRSVVCWTLTGQLKFPNGSQKKATKNKKGSGYFKIADSKGFARATGWGPTPQW